MSDLPTHLSNVHAALHAAPFDAAAAAQDAVKKALEDARALQSGAVVAAFERVAQSEPPQVQATLQSHCCQVHARLLMHDDGQPVDNADLCSLPQRVPPAEALFYHARMLCNNAGFWERCPEAARKARPALAEMLRNQGDFVSGWVGGEQGGRPLLQKTTDRFDAYIADSAVEHLDATHDKEGLSLARAAAGVTHALDVLGHPPRTAVINFAAPAATLFISTLICSPHGRFPRDGTLDSYVPAARTDPGAKPSVLAVSLTGIQHDAFLEYPLGTCKRAHAAYAAAPIHAKFGVPEAAIIDLAMPLLVRTAHHVGEVHFMTQLGKAILKTRPEKDAETARLTAEQRGAHLRDEIKLAKYWKAIEAALDPAEKGVLENAIQMMQVRQPISYLPLRGAVCSAAAPVLEDSDAAGTRSLHHVEVGVRIKGALTFPATALGRDPSINVRIDNNWTFESHVLCA